MRRQLSLEVKYFDLVVDCLITLILSECRGIVLTILHTRHLATASN